MIKNIPVKAYSENVTTMKTEIKPSSTETTEKSMSSHTGFETKIKTDQKLFSSSNQSDANKTQHTTENKIKIVDVKSSLNYNSKLHEDEALRHWFTKGLGSGFECCFRFPFVPIFCLSFTLLPSSG